MKKQNLLVTLLMACSIMPLAASDEKEVDINEITIIGNKAQVASDALRIITSLNKNDIAAFPVENISELLDYLPGIDIRQRGGNGVQADISMRGGTFDQVLVMINGVNITDVQTGHYNLDLPIDLSMIDHIEILQGTGSSLFGLSAFSGAINIITGQKSEETQEIKAMLTAGQNALYNANLGAKISSDNWTYSASGSYNRSDGYMYNTDYEYGNLFLQANGHNTASGKWNIQLGGQLKNFGANSFYSLAYPNQFEATKTLFGSVNWEKTFGRFNVAAAASYRTHYDRFELIRNMENAPAWYTGHNYHVTQSISGQVKASYFSSIGKTSAGIEIRDENIMSNVLGDSLNQTKTIPFTNDSLLFLFAKNRLNLNYFAEQSIYVGNWAASVGFSGNYNSMFKHNFCFGANASYNYAQNGNIYINLNRALRLPTFTDLYYQSATQTANPDLKPESSLTAEVGTKWSGYGFKLQAAAYYRMGKNIIDWVKTAEEEKWHSMNHTQINAMGGEASLSYHYGYWLKNIAVSYSFCHLTKESGELISKYALDYLKHKLVFSLEHGIYKGFGASWQMAYQNREGIYTDLAGQTQNYQPFWLLDGRIYWKNDNIKVFVESSNITNRHYYDYGGIMQAEQWLKTGISLTLHNQ